MLGVLPCLYIFAADQTWEASVKVKVRFFARLREETGLNEVELELDEATTLTDLIKAFFGDRDTREFLIAVNEELVEADGPGGVRLKDGDVVDIMPPASGG